MGMPASSAPLRIASFRSAIISLPFKPKQVLDLRDNGAVLKPKGNALSFDVPKDEIRLFYIKG